MGVRFHKLSLKKEIMSYATELVCKVNIFSLVALNYRIIFFCSIIELTPEGRNLDKRYYMGAKGDV